jgi:phosphohistidine phosphatase
MEVIFIRHGSAEPAGAAGDEARKLSGQGEAEVKAAVGGLKALLKGVDVILTSPLVRSVQTAEIVAAGFKGARVERADFLAPPAALPKLRKRLQELNQQDVWTVVLVGHAPSLDQYIGDLVAGKMDIGISLSKAGAACVVLPPAGSTDLPELRWLMRLEELAMLAGKAPGR